MSSTNNISNNRVHSMVVTPLQEHFPKDLSMIVMSYWSNVKGAFEFLKLFADNFNKAANSPDAALDPQKTQAWINDLASTSSFEQQMVKVSHVFEQIHSLVTEDLGSHWDGFQVSFAKIWKESRFSGTHSIPAGYVNSSLYVMSNTHKPIGLNHQDPLNVQPAGAKVYFLLDGKLYHFSIRQYSERTSRSILILDNDPSHPWICSEKVLKDSAPFSSSTLLEPFFLAGNVKKDSPFHDSSFLALPVIGESIPASVTEAPPVVETTAATVSTLPLSIPHGTKRDESNSSTDGGPAAKRQKATHGTEAITATTSTSSSSSKNN